MSAIEATTAGYKDMADNTLRITLEFEPRHAAAALALFGPRGTPVAVAALKIATTTPSEPAPKGGELARWVAMRCQEVPFQRWLQERFTREWGDAPGATPATWAASVIRAVCGIDSRAELDSNPEAANRLHRLIREPFAKEQT